MPTCKPKGGLDRLPQGHLMLAILAIDGIAHEIPVDQDLGMINIALFALVQLILWLDDA